LLSTNATNINYVDYENKTYLQHAIDRKDLDMVRLLLQFNINTNNNYSITGNDDISTQIKQAIEQHNASKQPITPSPSPSPSQPQ
jgi:ankyrin repeat protein